MRASHEHLSSLDRPASRGGAHFANSPRSHHLPDLPRAGSYSTFQGPPHRSGELAEQRQDYHSAERGGSRWSEPARPSSRALPRADERDYERMPAAPATTSKKVVSNLLDGTHASRKGVSNLLDGTHAAARSDSGHRGSAGAVAAHEGGTQRSAGKAARGGGGGGGAQSRAKRAVEEEAPSGRGGAGGRARKQSTIRWRMS